jgi:hypothetical protein
MKKINPVLVLGIRGWLIMLAIPLFLDFTQPN